MTPTIQVILAVLTAALILSCVWYAALKRAEIEELENKLLEHHDLWDTEDDLGQAYVKNRMRDFRAANTYLGWLRYEWAKLENRSKEESLPPKIQKALEEIAPALFYGEPAAAPTAFVGLGPTTYPIQDVKFPEVEKGVGPEDIFEVDWPPVNEARRLLDATSLCLAKGLYNSKQVLIQVPASVGVEMAAMAGPKGLQITAVPSPTNLRMWDILVVEISKEQSEKGPSSE